MRLPAQSPGFREVVALLRGNPRDPQPRNDRRSAGLVVDGGPTALVVNAPALIEVLAGAGYEVRAGRPEEAGRFEDDLCVLRDVPLPELGDGGARIRGFVEAGGGLIVLGGPSAFGPGGYAGRELSDCLPVRSAPEGEGLEVTILLDRSGTMGEGFSEEAGGVKLKTARQAVRRLIASLPDGTGFSLIPFAEGVDGRPRRIVLDQGTRSAALLAVERVVEATGSTAIIPPLSAARSFAPDKPDRKWLVLLVSDGRLAGESDEPVVDAALGLTKAGARLRALAVGQDANRNLLTRMVGSESGVLPVMSSGDFEKSFLAALLALEGEGRVLTGEFVVRRGEGAADSQLLPQTPLRGLVRTWERERARVLLETAEGYPVLAQWRYGLGRAAVLTTDPFSPWAPDWPASDLVRELAGAVGRPADLGSVRASVRSDPEGISIELYVTGDTSGVDGLLHLSDGSRHPVRFRPVGPGRLEVRLPGEVSAGAAHLSLETGGCGLSIPFPAEFEETGPDAEGIVALEALLPAAPPPGGRVPLAPVLGGLGLFLLLLDRVLLLGGTAAGLKRGGEARR